MNGKKLRCLEKQNERKRSTFLVTFFLHTIIHYMLFYADDRGGDYRGAQTADSKISATKLKGAKAMRVERLLRKMEERARRRQKRKEEVNRDPFRILPIK